MREIREGGDAATGKEREERREDSKEAEDPRRRARRDQNYPTRNSSLPISVEIIKRGEDTRCTRGGKEEKRDEGR